MPYNYQIKTQELPGTISMQTANFSSPNPKKQRGAFMVIALLLLIILSGFGIATVAETNVSARAGRNYSQYMEALAKAKSMAMYAKRILDSYPDATYPEPGTCTSSGTCYTADSAFPYNGRPVLAWSSGLGSAIMNGSSETNTWWNDNGFAYEGAFAGGGNARVIVSLLGTNPSSPYQHTYRIVGYATDSTGAVKATYQLFHVWNGFAADPGNNDCSGGGTGCNYAACCSNTTVCGTDQTTCDSGTATYVPPGWTCSDYFETGLGYSATSCTNPIAPP